MVYRSTVLKLKYIKNKQKQNKNHIQMRITQSGIN